MVDVRPIVSATRDSEYVTKYVLKGMGHRPKMVRRGFSRRWACSRNWPRPELHLRGTVEGRWHAQGMEAPTSALATQAERTRKHPYMARVGSDAAMAFDKKLRMKTQLRLLEGHIDNLRTAPVMERLQSRRPG